MKRIICKNCKKYKGPHSKGLCNACYLKYLKIKNPLYKEKCKKSKQLSYYKNKEKYLKKSKIWWKKNKKKKLNYDKEYYQNNKEKIKQRNKKNKCMDCGQTIYNTSKRCSVCNNLYQRGTNSPSWKGGRTILNGYIVIYKPNHPYHNCEGYVLEHRLIMEQHLRRHVKPNEIVHHVNGLRNDNRTENLQLMSNKEHSKLHSLLNPHNHSGSKSNFWKDGRSLKKNYKKKYYQKNRKWIIEQVKKYNHKPKVKKRIRKYMNHKYHTNNEFRKRHLQYVKNYKEHKLCTTTPP